MLARLVASLLAVLAVGAVPAPAADAAGTKCVALVVDFTTLGGSVTSSCVTVATTATGSDVLVKGHHTVTFDPRYGNDFICAIDGKPATGCHGTDDTHFWAYYHRAPHSNSWQISQEGAGTYKPANTATEGWVYDNGSSPAPKPSNVPYQSICANVASASPTPAPTATRRTTAATAPPTHHAMATMTPRATASPSTAGVTTLSAVAPPPPTPTPTPPPSSASSPATTDAAASRHSAKRFPWPLGLAVLVAAGLGTAAVVKLRRSSG